ncbi:Swt1 family HEPN domain-containing protein [Pedobacter agri]|uniref:Swt1 family HEPN domain-containing protein n=1 Tax=Pedobacter agri TaxID=454586 RepID=UPI00292D7D84|nr:Swt1 family HEPN domain-containing protein [Pedobacter agri]
MNWGKPKHLEENKYELPASWLHIHYFEALNILFRIENSLRLFVFIILKNEFKEKWKDLSVTSDDEESSTINSISRRRIMQDNNHAYLGYEVTSPLLHLTAGELIRIITSDKYWKYFKQYFLGSKEIIKTKLDEISNVRNSIAHFRPIKESDVELIKHNANHTLPKIQTLLIDIINGGKPMPTNSSENWYKELIKTYSDTCRITLQKTKDNSWVKVIITFNVPILSTKDDKWHTRYHVLKLNCYSLLISYPFITNNIISATEVTPSRYIWNRDDIQFQQRIALNFRVDNLDKIWENLIQHLKGFFTELDTEIELLKSDVNAKGVFVEHLQLYHKVGAIHPEIESDKFESEIQDVYLPEFWKEFPRASPNFIADTDVFPWMGVAISEDKSDNLPF